MRTCLFLLLLLLSIKPSAQEPPARLTIGVDMRFAHMDECDCRFDVPAADINGPTIIPFVRAQWTAYRWLAIKGGLGIFSHQYYRSFRTAYNGYSPAYMTTHTETRNITGELTFGANLGENKFSLTPHAGLVFINRRSTNSQSVANIYFNSHSSAPPRREPDLSITIDEKSSGGRIARGYVYGLDIYYRLFRGLAVTASAGGYYLPMGSNWEKGDDRRQWLLFGIGLAWQWKKPE